MTAVSAGQSADYAVDSKGTLWAWGDDVYGQLGDGQTNSGVTSCPVPVEGLSNVVAVSGGGSFALALLSDGTVWAFGINNAGELGNATTTNSDVPVQVQGLSNVVSVSAGYNSGYAVEGNGSVWAWGNNPDGQMGIGNTTQQLTPVQVEGVGGSGDLSNIAQVAGGQDDAMAVSSSGQVYSWGLNTYGELGNGTTTQETTPVQVEGVGGAGTLANVVQLDSGYATAVALTQSGNVVTWGENQNGQLGNGNNTGPSTCSSQACSTTPISVSNIGSNSGSSAVAAGSTTTYVIGQPVVTLSSSQVNFAPQALFQESSSSTITVTNSGNAPLTVNQTSIIGQDADSFAITGDSCSGNTIAAGGSCTVGVRETPVAAGSLTAQLDINSNVLAANTYVPLSGAGLPSPTTGLSFAVAPGLGFATGSDANGQLGAGDIGATYVSAPKEVKPASLSFVQLAAGSTHSLGLDASGDVWAWGGNSYGQLGNDSTTDSWTPVQVPLPSGAVSVSAGYNHSLAVTANGNVWAWGDNNNGQLGTGNNTGPNTCTGSNVACGITPVQVQGVSDAVAVSAGGSHSLALEANGTVWAWGNNADGQLGTGNTTSEYSPTEVTGLPTDIVAISAGENHSLALTSTGVVYAWGLNGNGQLGNGGTTQQDTPVQVSGISTAVAIAAGANHSLALLTNGTVDAWGLNASGQLGNGGTTQEDSPVPVTGLSGVTQIAAGQNHSSAVTSSGQAYAWGLNSNGQLGNGNTTQQDAPVQMTSVGNGAAAVGIGSGANDTLLVGQPYANLSATTLAFSTEPVGTPAPALTETVTNNGIMPLQITADQIIGGDGDQFKITGDGCVGTTVAPGASCVIGVRYEPIVSGSPVATLRITSNSPTSPSLVTLDPPAPKRASSRKLSCHSVRRDRRYLTLSCTSEPRFGISGVGTARLMSGEKILAAALGHIRDRHLVVVFRIEHLNCRTLTVTVQVSDITGRSQIVV